MQQNKYVELATVKRLYRFSGFVARYYEILEETPGIRYTAAYEVLEVEFESIFGYRRFMSYDSFRVTKHYHKGQSHYIK